MIDSATGIAEKLSERAIVGQVLHRAMVSSDSLYIEMKRGTLEDLLVGGRERDGDAPEHLITFTIPLRCQRRGVETKLVLPMACDRQRRLLGFEA